MDILRMIRRLFDKKQKTYAELDDKYVIVTNTLSYPVLCLKTSIIVSETEKALYRFDTAAPEGKGRVFAESDVFARSGKDNYVKAHDRGAEG